MRILLLLLLALSLNIRADDDAAVAGALPRPLTLEAALSFAQDNHPDLDLARANVLKQEAGTLESVSDAGFQAALDLSPRWVRPTQTDPSGDAWLEDHYGEISVTKRLTDFGRTSALKRGGGKRYEAAQTALIDTINRRTLEVMRLFFDVLIADITAQRDNEAMAMRYVTFDKQRDKHEQGEVSDVELLKAESEYEEVRLMFYRSRAEQSVSRARLAAALNVPGQIPSDLETPNLAAVVKPVPEYQQISLFLLENNPALKQKRLLVAAAEQELKAARAERYPDVSAELAAFTWDGELGNRNDAMAGLRLNVPLYQGGKVRAAIAAAQVGLIEAKADQRKTELQLYELAMELSERLANLKAEKESLQTLLDYRDLYLERSGALYELEEKTDLGDAMVQLTSAQQKVLKTDLDLALAWKQLEVLGGGRLPEVRRTEEEQNNDAE